MKITENYAAWESQVWQYPPTGDPGITLEHYTITIRGHITVVDCLLYRDAQGALIGIWCHYNENNPDQLPGSCNLWVHPDHQRQGIATALLRRADELWDLRDQDTYTTAGNAWIEALVAQGRIDATRTGSLEPNPQSISARKVPR